jgi:hypothetical protein
VKAARKNFGRLSGAISIKKRLNGRLAPKDHPRPRQDDALIGIHMLSGNLPLYRQAEYIRDDAGLGMACTL